MGVLRLICVRLLWGVGTLFVVSLIIFLGVEALPGDLAENLLGQGASDETVEALRRRLGLDRPAPVRYFSWLWGFTQGDIGFSLATGREVADLIGFRLYNTFFLAAYAAALSVPLALGLGVLAALYRNGFFDRAVNAFSLISISFPEFFIGYVILIIFANQLAWFPSLVDVSPEDGFAERVYRLTLPAVTLTLAVLAHMMRLTRASILQLLSNPYIEMAYLKGLPPRRIVFRHALPNAMAPISNVVVLNLAYLIVGVVVVEVVFTYPGLGQLMIDSVAARDLPVVQACALIFAATYVSLNILADILAIVFNPRLLHPK